MTSCPVKPHCVSAVLISYIVQPAKKDNSVSEDNLYIQSKHGLSFLTSLIFMISLEYNLHLQGCNFIAYYRFDCQGMRLAKLPTRVVHMIYIDFRNGYKLRTRSAM